MNTSLLIMGLGIALGGSASAGTFQNLDFDEADTSQGIEFSDLDGSSYGRGWAPGWSAQRGQGTVYSLTAIYLNRSMGGPDAATLYDANYLWGLPLEGKLAYLATTPSGEERGRVSLLQTGLIPPEARSLRYKYSGGVPDITGGSWDVRVNGMQLDLHDPAEGTTGLALREVAIDITDWAGQEVELKFTQRLGYHFNSIDSIRFSEEPVIPEPRKGMVLLLGGGLLSWLGWGAACRRRSHAPPDVNLGS